MVKNRKTAAAHQSWQNEDYRCNIMPWWCIGHCFVQRQILPYHSPQREPTFCTEKGQASSLDSGNNISRLQLLILWCVVYNTGNPRTWFRKGLSLVLRSETELDWPFIFLLLEIVVDFAKFNWYFSN